MAEVQHAQIKSKLQEQVCSHIDQTGLNKHKGTDLENQLLTRAVAAVALNIAADIDIPTAASAIVDGGTDNGIDAIYYDGTSRTLYLPSQNGTIHIRHQLA